MKRRVIKKNINRFITPLLKDLPRTHYYAQEIELPGDMRMVVQKQHIIVNGKVTQEGERYFICDNLLLNIRRTADTIRKVIDEHDHVYLRVGLRIDGNRTYARLITE